MKTVSEEYPELDNIAQQLFERVINKINAKNQANLETNCPYPRQCILEMVIAKLEEVV